MATVTLTSLYSGAYRAGYGPMASALRRLPVLGSRRTLNKLQDNRALDTTGTAGD